MLINSRREKFWMMLSSGLKSQVHRYWPGDDSRQSKGPVVNANESRGPCI